MLTHDEFTKIVEYNQETGEFIALVSRGRIKAGKILGYKTYRGRIEIEIYGKVYQAPRLAFFYMNGEWPKNQIDHINCVRDDNRWCNLREATASQNQANRPVRKSKQIQFKGVTVKKHLPKPFIAQISKDGKVHHLGCFLTPEEAHKAYCDAAQKMHGEFWRG